MIRRDKNRALELLLHKLENKRNNLDFISFVSSKSFMADSEILIIINFLMKKREESPIIDTLIVQFAHRVRLKIRDITDCLDYKIPKDFSLKMKLLGSIGSKHPDMVFAELVSYAYESLPSSRRQVYAAINMLDRSACDKIVETYLEILTRETDAANIKKIKGALRKMRKV
ncbi:MAG: hypothetical protein M0D53_02095 [Flavobacterium sp. JAD_PAG50586_2]|nr:MAG: hypothetical protein M0D53_02095 [Flavobacterium sp. JAD_PAG50586_2]